MCLWDRGVGHALFIVGEESPANKMRLIEELMTTNMGVQENVQLHIEKIRRILGKLGILNMTVDNEQYKLGLLRSFPCSYEVVTFENLQDMLQIEELHSHIIREEARRSTVENEPTTPTGLVDNNLFQDRVIVCHLCKKKGHKKAKCWALKRKQQANQHNKNDREDTGNPKRV